MQALGRGVDGRGGRWGRAAGNGVAGQWRAEMWRRGWKLLQVGWCAYDLAEARAPHPQAQDSYADGPLSPTIISPGSRRRGC